MTIVQGGRAHLELQDPRNVPHIANVRPPDLGGVWVGSGWGLGGVWVRVRSGRANVGNDSNVQPLGEGETHHMQGDAGNGENDPNILGGNPPQVRSAGSVGCHVCGPPPEKGAGQASSQRTSWEVENCVGPKAPPHGGRAHEGGGQPRGRLVPDRLHQKRLFN